MTDAELIHLSLTERGHSLLNVDGELEVGGTLTPDELDLIEEFKDELLPLATIDVIRFVGEPSTSVPIDWRPDSPPDLTGINEIVLNFATSGLKWHAGDRPIGVTVSTLDGQMTRFLPFGFKHGGNLDEGQIKEFVRGIRGKKIYNANTKFDIHHSREWGADLEAQGNTFSDIQHTAALLDDGRKMFRLDKLGPDYLPDLPTMARVDERRHADHHAGEVDARERYTAELVWRIKNVMYPQIAEQELGVVQALEDDVIPAVVEMEKNGAPMDMALNEQYYQTCNQKHDELIWEISREAGFAFEHTDTGWKNLLSRLNIPSPDAFDEATLSMIDHPLVRKGQRAKQYAQLNSKTFKAYRENVVDGILRYGINQVASDKGGTVSGRFSIGYVQQVPNLDNHTRAFGDELFPRNLFVPGEGEYLESDAAQIEYRYLVHLSKNQDIINEYMKDPKISFHKMTWERMKRYKADMLYTHQKSFNFAYQYGAKSLKLAMMMGFITAAEEAEIRAAKRWDDPRLDLIHEIEDAYKKMMPEAGELMALAAHYAKPTCDKYCRNDNLHREFKHRGYVKTIDGRRSRFPNAYKTYIGLNRVIQGSCADIMKRKLVELHRERKYTGFTMRMTVHDAVSGDATLHETKERVSEILNQQSYDLRVPILWAIGTGPNWAACKS